MFREILMAKSFYHFLMRYRQAKPQNHLARFANDAFLDHGFPKSSRDYQEISDYLEFNGDYLPTMQIFDQAWELYLQIEKPFD